MRCVPGSLRSQTKPAVLSGEMGVPGALDSCAARHKAGSSETSAEPNLSLGFRCYTKILFPSFQTLFFRFFFPQIFQKVCFDPEQIFSSPKYPKGRESAGSTSALNITQCFALQSLHYFVSHP